jgi:penicillin-binding protein 1A
MIPDTATNPATPSKSPKSKGPKRWIRFVWIGLITFLTATFLLFFCLSQGFLGEMPDVKELENPDIYVASEIISSDGQVIGKFEKEKTIPVLYKDLPPYLVYALQAKEDERFKEHSGIDLKSIGRALRYGGSRGGGSTITQQLAKLLFTEKPSRNKITRAVQKLREWSVAVSLEKRYTKEEIVTLYFNKFDFLYNANGIEMAAKIYFNKSAKELSLSEAAMFVAMLENPRLNNPMKNMTRAVDRRNVVLDQMLKTGYIDQKTFDKATADKINLDYHPIKDITEGYSAYFKFALRKEVDQYLKDYEKETGKVLNLYKSGLKIYVTLDSRMQTYAEESIKEHLTKLQASFDSHQRHNPTRPFYKTSKTQADAMMVQAMKRTGRYKLLAADGMPMDSILMEFKKPVPSTKFTWQGEEDIEMSPWDSIRYHKQIAQAGLMAMEPMSGDIKAWVGGIDWKHYQFDHVKQGKRQVGSTFKPFVYATAIMELGMTPCTPVSNAAFSIGNWHPKNSSGRYGGSLTLKQALGHSVNVIAARLIAQTGYERVQKTARDLGVTSDMPNNYTIALGSSDITLYEMLGAYSTFANYGNYIKPQMIWRIEDPNGRLIKEMKPEVKEVMNELYAYSMIDLMKGPAEFGTASSGLKAHGITGEVACKTGTTNNNSDGWFIGITPKLSAGVWVGWEDRSVHFQSTGEGQGAKMALPIWGLFMQKVYKDESLKISQEDKFVKPSNWKGDCSDLKGIGYDMEEGLRTIDQLKAEDSDPYNYDPTSPRTKSPAIRREDDLNQNLNKTEDPDFNN